MKNFNILGFHWKIQLLGGREFIKNWYRGGDCLKRGAWTVFRFKGGALQEREGWCFWGGVDTPMHTMHLVSGRLIKVFYKTTTCPRQPILSGLKSGCLIQAWLYSFVSYFIYQLMSNDVWLVLACVLSFLSIFRFFDTNLVTISKERSARVFLYYQLLGCLRVSIWPLPRLQSQPPNILHCIFTILNLISPGVALGIRVTKPS